MAALLNIQYALIISNFRLTHLSLCSVDSVFRRNAQKYFANHVIEIKQTSSELECGMHCAGRKSCVSVNYKTSGVGKGRCELNNKTIEETSYADRSTKPDYNHLYIIGTKSKVKEVIWQMQKLFR